MEEKTCCYPRIFIKWSSGEESCLDYSLNQFYLAFYDFEDYLKTHYSHFKFISFYLVQNPGADFEHCQRIIHFNCQ